MKLPLAICLAFGLQVFVLACSAQAAERAMERLPPGSVKPEGWLREQMELQRNGLAGAAEKLYVDIGESDWLTGGRRGGQFAWERGPYYAKGLVALAFALDDAWLKSRAKRWVEAFLASQRANGDFGTRDRNWWANMIALWTLRDWCEATGDARVVPFMERYFSFQKEAFAKGDSFAKDSPWAVARVGDELDVIIWLYRRTDNAGWLDYARTVAAMSADWTDYYRNGGFGGWGAGGLPRPYRKFHAGAEDAAFEVASGRRRRRPHGVPRSPRGRRMGDEDARPSGSHCERHGAALRPLRLAGHGTLRHGRAYPERTGGAWQGRADRAFAARPYATSHNTLSVDDRDAKG